MTGVLIGVAVQKLVMPHVQRLASKTPWQGDDILFAGVRHYVVVWGALAGFFTGISAVDLSSALSSTLYKTLVALAILTVTMAIARVAAGLVALHAQRVIGSESSVSIFRNVTKIIVFTVGLLMVLQQLGISITPMLTAMGVGGLAVALALQDTLSNLFAGIQILASKKVKPGDYIQLDSGQEGYVSDVTWRNTTIRALPNNHIIIPNSKLAAALVTNFYRPEKDLAILVQVGVAYESDLAHVEDVTISVAREVMRDVPGGVTDFEPFIRYNTFGDFSIGFTVIMRGKEYTDQYLVKHEFIKRLHRRYAQEGIQIPFPVRSVRFAAEPSQRGAHTLAASS
jgi:small-conductance mechanosensitive channel